MERERDGIVYEEEGYRPCDYCGSESYSLNRYGDDLICDDCLQNEEF